MAVLFPRLFTRLSPLFYPLDSTVLDKLYILAHQLSDATTEQDW
jgi:hypothetical protein